MSKKKKAIIIGFSFLAVLLCGFVFGRYIFTNKSSNVEVNLRDERGEANKNINVTRENAITETVKKVSSAVVGINVTEIREFRDPFNNFFGDDPFFKHFFGDRSFKQEVQGLGSGFIISDDGYILTNDHVVGNASKIVVSMTNGEHVDAEIVGKDSFSDITLLKINKSNLPFLKFGNSDDVIIGEWVVALGNPFGLFEVNQKPTVTVGVVSATGMKLSAGGNRFYRNMVQTDAPINSGNSGGPLVNSLGEVIGMNTLIFTGSQFSQGNIGLGFAIAINKVKRIVEELKKDGKINRNYWLGLRVQTIDKNIAQYFKLKNITGVIAVSVEKGSSGDKSGIKPEDVIVSLNGEKVSNEIDFWGIVAEHRIGDKLKLKLLRAGEEVEKEIELMSK